MDPKPLLRDLRTREHPALLVEPEPPSTPASVALVAGSFDPITVAHEALAEEAATLADLVVFVYSVRTLPKEPGAPPPLLDEETRVRWLMRFAAERPGRAVGLSSHGLLADQSEAAAERFPGAALSLVMGSDKLLQVLDPSWYDDRDGVLARTFELAGILVAVRSGDDDALDAALAAPENAEWRSRIQRLDVSPDVAGVSSRKVRELLTRGEDVSALVPESVRALLDQRSGGS